MKAVAVYSTSWKTETVELVSAYGQKCVTGVWVEWRSEIHRVTWCQRKWIPWQPWPPCYEQSVSIQKETSFYHTFLSHTDNKHFVINLNFHQLYCMIACKTDKLDAKFRNFVAFLFYWSLSVSFEAELNDTDLTLYTF